MESKFQPKLITILREGYDRKQFTSDLIAGIIVGIVALPLAIAFAIASGVEPRELEEEEDTEDPKAISKRRVPPGVEVFEIYGSLFFAAVDQFKDALRRVEKNPKVLILRMRHVLALDASGLKAIEDLYKKLQKDKSVLILSGVHAQPLVAMDHAGFLDRIGEENIQPDIDEALQRAQQILEESGRG